MIPYGAKEHVLSGLDRLVDLAVGSADTELLYRVPSVVRFLHDHPFLRGIAVEIGDEATRRRRSLAEDGDRILASLRLDMDQLVGPLREHENGELQTLCDDLCRGVDEHVRSPDIAPRWRITKDDPDDVRQLLDSIHKILWRADSCECLRDHEDSREKVRRFREALLPIKMRRESLLRAFHLDLTCSPAFALDRLRYLSRALEFDFKSLGEIDFVRFWFEDQELASLLFGSSPFDAAGPPVPLPGYSSHAGTVDGSVTLERLAHQVRRDLRTVHVGVRGKVDELQSVRAVVDRYVARSVLFDSARLREIANNSHRHPEAALTLDFARYLFDQGLNPLIEPTVASLRPDLLAPGQRWTMYVEAKQYSGGPTREQVRDFGAQTWSTWGRLRANWDVREAFLIVFRRSGRVVHFPEEVRYEGLVLHPILVDIAEASASGSRAGELPLDVQAADLMPEQEP